MPRQNMIWDDEQQRGNPTKSSAVNNIIGKVKKHEARGTGVSSCARRAVEWDEFISLLTLARMVLRDKAAIMLLALLTLQWQLIARVDNCLRLATTTILFNFRDPFTLWIKMCWSKNI